MSFILIFPSLAATSQNVAAQGITEDPVEFNDTAKQQIKEDIEFYFSEVGYINENREYIVTDAEALNQHLNSYGLELNVPSENQSELIATANSLPQYGLCVVANALPFPFTGTAYELGVALVNDDNFINALMQGSADLASEILMNYATTILPANMLSELTNFGIITNAAFALVSCAL